MDSSVQDQIRMCFIFDLPFFSAWNNHPWKCYRKIGKHLISMNSIKLVQSEGTCKQQTEYD